MPLYEHKCRSCGAKFEERDAAADRETGKPKCPKCGSVNVARVFSLFTRASAVTSGPAPRRRC